MGSKGQAKATAKYMQDKQKKLLNIEQQKQPGKA